MDTGLPFSTLSLRSKAPLTRFAPLFLAAICLVFLTACSRRSITKPHSELVEEARGDGQRMLSARQERQRFYQYERRSQKRLEALLNKRHRMAGISQKYRLGAGDLVDVNVFDVPELNVSVRVRDSGILTLPLIGAVRAAGRTENELQSEVSERLTRFVKQPEVSVFITEYGSQQVAVLGAVKEPGSYALKKGRNSLLELVSEAGGITEAAGNYINFVPVEVLASSTAGRAQMNRTFAARRTWGGGKTTQNGIEVYLEDVLGTGGGIPLDLPVRGGDMIIVPEAGKVTVEGEVEARGSYELGQRTTLLGALAAAGGVTYSAKIDELEVVRTFSPHERARLVLSLEEIMSGKESDVPLRNGDLVRVPSDSGRRMRQDTFESIQSLIRFGVGGTVNMGP